MDDWIDARHRLPQEGETITLPGLKGRYEVRGAALYDKGKLAMPISIIEKYKIEDEQSDNE